MTADGQGIRPGWRYAATAALLAAICVSSHRVSGAEPTAQPGQAPAIDAATARRAEAALVILRTYRKGIRDEQWTRAMRELVAIGKPVIPLLIEELDRTTRDESLRALAFVMRAVGDARAVPALIRAIPRTLMSGIGDWNWREDEDPEMVRFVEQHTVDRVFETGVDHSPGRFGYRRPFLEVTGTLRQLTGAALWELEINYVFLDGSPEQQRLKRELYRELTCDWANWWSENWHRFVPDAAAAEVERTFAAVGRTTRPAGPPRREFPLGPTVQLERHTVQITILPPFNEAAPGSCLDLDTGRRLTPPAHLVAGTGPQPSPELLQWARRTGVDLIGVRHQPPWAAQSFRCLLPLDMRLRPANRQLTVHVVNAGRRVQLTYNNESAILHLLKSGTPIEFPKLTPRILAVDPASATITAFVTREGSCGFLTLNPPDRNQHISRVSGRWVHAKLRGADGNDDMAYRFVEETPPK